MTCASHEILKFACLQNGLQIMADDQNNVYNHALWNHSIVRHLFRDTHHNLMRKNLTIQRVIRFCSYYRLVIYHFGVFASS